MAKSKDDIKYATSQARLSEDEAVRVAFVHDTPLEGGKIADSEPVDLFSSAHNVAKSSNGQQTADNSHNQAQLQRGEDDAANTNNEGGSTDQDFTTGAPRLPKKGAPPTMAHKF